MHQLGRLAIQYARFGAVGLTAAATHVLVFAAAIEFAHIPPLLANCLAFGIAVWISFFGHFRWTFADQTGSGSHEQQAALLRFIIVALTGFGLNSLSVYVVVNVMAWPYAVAAFLMITAVPVAVFALSKFWAFAAIPHRSA